MLNFKTGDKVIFNKENVHVGKQFDYKRNTPYEVQEVSEIHKTLGITNEDGVTHFFEEERFELVKKKPTKNQRITALENEVAELKLIVHELRGKKLTTTATVFIDGVPADISNAPEIQMKAKPTPNQQRAAIIEKAKEFVKNIVGEYDTFNTTIGRYKDQCVRPIFHANENKRAITVLIYGAFSKELIFKGIAKCNSNDVFNQHIGKAIALGRALGLDVSEFEQAVQPNEVVMGMNLEVRTNGEVDFNHKPVDTDDLIQCNHDFHKEDSGVFIINDTNAIY